jgi:hypothetical protein
VFFYTRCDNPMKCSLTIAKLARVQALLEARGLAGRIRTAAFTYDPAFDLPDRLRIYGQDRGVRTDAGHRLFRAAEDNDALREHFGLGVGFVGSLVNRHRIELYVLDAEGRAAVSFEQLRWDERKSSRAAAMDEPAEPLAYGSDNRCVVVGRRCLIDALPVDRRLRSRMPWPATARSPQQCPGTEHRGRFARARGSGRAVPARPHWPAATRAFAARRLLARAKRSMTHAPVSVRIVGHFNDLRLPTQLEVERCVVSYWRIIGCSRLAVFFDRIEALSPGCARFDG